MHFRDHPPPHFHVRYGRAAAQIRVAPVELLEGSLPPRLLAMAYRWANLHQAELLRIGTECAPIGAFPNCSTGGTLHPFVTAVHVLPPYGLRLRFEDGSDGYVDARSWVGDSPGIFAELRDPSEFAKVYVNHESGTIEWPNGADVDPDTLYEEAHRASDPPPE